MLRRVVISIVASAARGANGNLTIVIAKPPPLPPQLRFFTRRLASSYLQSTHLAYCCSLNYAILFDQIFSRLKKSPPHHLSEARNLHALLIVAGLFQYATSDATDAGLYSQLVRAYVRFGSLEEALLVFHQLPHNQKSNIAWNAILRGYVDAGMFSEAIEFYHLMLAQGIVPDNFTYPLILKACSWLSALQLGREVVERIQLNGTCCEAKHNVFVECAAIDMFAKCGSLGEARTVFEEMPRKDLASWTAIISGTAQNGDSLEALQLFRSMRLEEGIRPDSVVVAAVLPACARLEARQLGMTLQGCAVRSGFEVDLYVSNALVDMYCKCGDTPHAYQMFSNMVYKDVVSWGTLIAGFAQNCQYCQSVELYLEMKSLGIRTTAVSAASVLPGFAKLNLLKQGKEMHNYILRQGFQDDTVVGSALVDMYSNCGSKRAAERIFDLFSDRDIMIWNSMIVGHASDENFDSAYRIFRRLGKDSRLRPNSITLISILPVCTKMGSVERGKEIHGYAIRSRLEMVISVQNSLVDMYCKCGYLHLGVKVFDQMLEKNIVTYNTVISAHGTHGQAQQAFSLFEKMKAAKIRPNKVTFIGLLSACSHAGLVDRGWSLYSSMTDDYHLQPDMEHYSCMVDLLGRAGKLGDACNFVKQMTVEPDSSIFGSLLGASRAHNKVELADLIGRKLSEREWDFPGYHILLSNIYSSVERWEDASKVRTMMKDKGLMKKPGKSWIQIGGSVHTFRARDIMHPVFHIIEETLESIFKEMKNEGYILDAFFSEQMPE